MTQHVGKGRDARKLRQETAAARRRLFDALSRAEQVDQMQDNRAAYEASK